MDKSITSLPGDMGLTSCKEVFFFNPQRKWRAGLRPRRQLNVHPAMYLTGVVTLRFDEALTPCYFGRILDLKFPTSVQTIFCGQSAYNYNSCSLQPDWFLRVLPASVTTCVLTRVSKDTYFPGFERHVLPGFFVSPNHLRSLTLDGEYILIREGVLPFALETLVLAGEWTLRPTNVLSGYLSIVKLVLNHSPGGSEYLAMDHSMYPPNLETLVLGPYTTDHDTPVQIPGSVKTLVLSSLVYTNQVAVGVFPEGLEGLTRLELVDVDFRLTYLDMIGFPESLQYVKISVQAAGLEGATSAVDFLKSYSPDILVEVGSTEYEDVFFRKY
jgi:hypothetical protein